MDASHDGEARPIINVTGEKIALGPMRRELLPLYQRWTNDFEVTRTLGEAMVSIGVELQTAWYEREAAGRDRVAFTVYELPALRPIGTTALHNIDHRLRRAEFSIAIGETDCWGKGYGTETARLVLDYGFTALNLHNILLTTQAFNEGGLRAYQRAGFKEIGRRREAHWLGGRAYDVVYMDCLATEFESLVLHRHLP